MKNLGAISASLESSTRAENSSPGARHRAERRQRWSKAMEIADGPKLPPRSKASLPTDTRFTTCRTTSKTAVAAGTTTDATWAAPLITYQSLANSFLESLRNYGCFDRMLGSMRRVPFENRVGASPQRLLARLFRKLRSRAFRN